MKAEKSIIKKAFGSLSPAFRGTIWEDALRYKLHGKAYESLPQNQNGHFWIKTARHLTGPLLALDDDDVRHVFIIGATQCLKTIAGDLFTISRMEHRPRNMLVLFETDAKAKAFCDIRLMEVIKKHPVLKKQLAEANRHDVTKTYIKLAGMDLLAAGLNDSNLSTFSWPYIRISEAWQAGKNGMLKKAMKRADRFPDNCKILIESQAGRAEEDLHTESMAAHQVPLTWACPFCGGRQTWETKNEFGNQRGEDFIPMPAIHPLAEPPKPGTFSGMKFASEGTLDERARTAKWECHHCATLIDDAEENRMAIMDSYQQNYKLPDGKSPKSVCFILPREAMWNNTFESAVKSYLMAKESEAAGNMTKIEDWYMSERAIFYSPRMSHVHVPIVTASGGDPKDLIPDEKIRTLSVDCQQDDEESQRLKKQVTGNFWYVAEATDKFGNVTQLARGWATSWEELFGKDGADKEKKGFKARLGIPTRNVAIDGSKWGEDIRQKAAFYRTAEKALDGSGSMVWATWKVLEGDEGKGQRHDDGVWRFYWMPKTYHVDVLNSDNTWTKGIAVQVTRWSNYVAKSLLYKLLKQGVGTPKFTAAEIVDKKTKDKEVGNFSYENQMNGFQPGEGSNGKPKFIEMHPQQHYPDCACQGIVLRAMAGLIRGESAGMDISAQEAAKP